MATKIYGVCSGTYSNKYDLWTSVTENYQSVNANSSNVTVKVYLKRNDGIADSAYNLYQSENSVKLAVCGTTRVSENITVDTRDNVTVLLASWSGNVTHNNDGKLNMTVSVDFVMGNTSLSGGSIDGVFKCTAIPRASSLTLSATTVNPGSSVRATVSASAAGFSHKIQWRIGDEYVNTSLSAGVSVYDFTVPNDWANLVTNSTSSTITIVLYTYNGNVSVGSKSYSLKFIIPATEEYKPGFDISIVKNNNGAAESFSEYIKGVSSVTVEPANLTFKYGAQFAAVTITVGSVSIRRYPATFALVSSGEVLVNVAVRDSRGLLTVKSTTISVCDYIPPSLDVVDIFRCTQEGVAHDTGIYASLSYECACSSVNGNNSPTISLCYRNTKNSEGYTDVGQITSSPFVFGGDFEVGETYEVTLSVVDKITTEAAEVVCYVSGGAVPFNIRKGGKGASFGKYSESDGLLDVDWDMHIKGDISIDGLLDYESVSCVGKDMVTDVQAKIRYYPCLNIAFLRLRMDVTKDLAADTTYYIADVVDCAPTMYTPLECNGAFYTSDVYSAGISYSTGEIVFRSNNDLVAGTRIYISGYYFAEKD